MRPTINSKHEAVFKSDSPASSQLLRSFRLQAKLGNCGNIAYVICIFISRKQFLGKQIPMLHIDMVNAGSTGSGSSSTLPAPLHRTIVAFEKSILECHYLCERCPAILRALEEVVRSLSTFYERLDDLIDSAGLKGKQSARVYDVYGWNMGLITNHVELLQQCRRDCQHTLDVVRIVHIWHRTVDNNSKDNMYCRCENRTFR